MYTLNTPATTPRNNSTETIEKDWVLFNTSYGSRRARCTVYCALVEEAQNLATSVLLLGFLVVHDASRSGQDHEAKLTGRQQVVRPVVHAVLADVEARRDNTSFVDSAQQSDDDLARAVVVDDLVLADVAVLLHDIEELEDNLGAGAEENYMVGRSVISRMCVLAREWKRSVHLVGGVHTHANNRKFFLKKNAKRL